MPDIQIYDSEEDLILDAADHFAKLAEQAIARSGMFCVAVSGGQTPERLYERLASPEMRIDWEHVSLFWVDERCVPHQHPDSNYWLVRRTLIDRVNISTENIHPISGDLAPAPAAEAYVEVLRRHFDLSPNGLPPRFDLVLLGIGDDGHTASLFPGVPGLLESRSWVAPVVHDTPPEPVVDRVTLTLPVINAASQVTFLVTGENKRQAVRQVLLPNEQTVPPAGLVQPVGGSLLWMIDAAAAGGIVDQLA